MPIGSIIGGIIGQQGANAAAGMAQQAGAQANAQAFAQGQANTSNASPYTALGLRGTSILGGLLGYGTLKNSGGQGGTYDFQTDPAAYGNSAALFNAFKSATNAPVPTFTPMSAVSSTFQADPSYDWRVQQGTAALDRSAAAKGMLLSGAQEKNLTDYGQNAASQEYGNWFNRYLTQSQYNAGGTQQQYANTENQFNNTLNAINGFAGMGNQAQASLAGTNSGLVANANNALVSSAATAGQDTMAGANALASGINNGLQNALMGAYLGFNPTSGLFKNLLNSGGGGASGYSASLGNVGRAGSFGVNF